MRPVLVLALWAALTVAAWVAAYAWSLLGHLLIPIGAVVMASAVMFVAEGVVQEIRLARLARRYERQRQAFLTNRDRSEREDG